MFKCPKHIQNHRTTVPPMVHFHTIRAPADPTPNAVQSHGVRVCSHLKSVVKKRAPFDPVETQNNRIAFVRKRSTAGPRSISQRQQAMYNKQQTTTTQKKEEGGCGKRCAPEGEKRFGSLDYVHTTDTNLCIGEARLCSAKQAKQIDSKIREQSVKREHHEQHAI